MSLTIFDLDYTLIGGDSDYLWGQFLTRKGIVDKAEYEERNTKFYQQYRDGELDIAEFLKFALKPLAMNTPRNLYRWRKQFIEEEIKPILLPLAHELIRKHREESDTLLVITATNHFVTEPIVSLLGIKNMLATMPEIANGHFTGEFSGIPCFRDGKVKRLEQWLSENGANLQGSRFYSDSHNDLPLLLRVDNPVAVDPDDQLRAYADNAGWPIISLR